MPTIERTPEGRFQPGQSGNPAGRQPGTRNKATMAAEALLDGEVEEVTRRIADQAMSGNPVAMRLCFERLAPRRKGRPVVFALPKLVTHADAVEAAATIVAGVGAGELTPAEAADLIKLVQGFAGVRSALDLEWRVTRIEKTLGTKVDGAATCNSR
jgi:uncharacterized protein DUF5681